MPDHDSEISQRRAAIVATIGLLVTIAGVIIAVSCGALPNLVIKGDAGDGSPEGLSDAQAGGIAFEVEGVFDECDGEKFAGGGI